MINLRDKKIIFGFLIFLLLLSSYIVFDYVKFLRSPINFPQNKSFDYTLTTGTSVRGLAFDWQKQGVLQRPIYFCLLAYSKGKASQLKAGEYIFESGLTPSQILEQLVDGKNILRHFTLIEGWNIKRVMRALNNNPYVQHTLTSDISNEQLLNQLNVGARSLEGLLFPDTYKFTRGTTDVVLLQQAYQKMQTTLQEAWLQRAPGLPYKTSYDALIAASLIEKETAKSDERPLVAAVIKQRLQMNMPLQMDSSVIYGLADHYDGHINKADLHLETPYNTYVNKGLPPTPIAMPSAASINAVLNPAQTNALYFVANGSGGHQFSATLAEHNKAVQTYQVKVRLPYIGRKRYDMDCEPVWYMNVDVRNLLNNSCRVKFI